MTWIRRGLCAHNALNRVCLQISAGVLLEARAALEEFLAVWASNNTREVSSPVAGHLGKYRSAVVVSSSINGESSSRMFLTEEKFGGIAEIYVVQVLVKGFRDPKSAVEWIQHANLTQDKRMVSKDGLCYFSGTEIGKIQL